MFQAVNVLKKFDEIKDYWSPKIIGEVNGQYVKIARLKGEFVWHQHEDEDELFYVIKGTLKIEMEEGAVILREGEFFNVPQKVRHNPLAEEECWVMMIEPKSTKHTGDVVTDQTKSIEDQF